MNLKEEKAMILADIKQHELRIKYLKERYKGLLNKTQPEVITRDCYVIKSMHEKTEIRAFENIYLSQTQIKEIHKQVKEKYNNKVIFIK